MCKNRLNTSIDATEVALPTAQTKLMNRGQMAENRWQNRAIANLIAPFLLCFFYQHKQILMAPPILNAIMCKNRRSGDKAKPDFGKLLGVGAWGRASGSRVEAHSATPSARVACPWGANRRYGTKFTQTVLIALLLLCFFYPQTNLIARPINLEALPLN